MSIAPAERCPPGALPAGSAAAATPWPVESIGDSPRLNAAGRGECALAGMV